MSKESIARTLLRARTHHKKGETAQARALYLSVLKAFPNNKRARQAIAALDHDMARTAANAPSPAKSQIDALNALYAQGRFTDVVEEASQLVHVHPSSFLIWSFLGTASAQSGQNQRAVRAFTQAIKLNPKDAGSHFGLGVALQSLGQWNDAIAAYKRAIAIQPHHADAYNNLGNAYKNVNNLDAALAAYKRALAIRPDNAGTHNNIGTILRERGQLDAAITAYEMALKINPQFADAHRNMGNALREQDRQDEAIIAYQRAAKITPDNAETFNSLGVALDENKLPDDAITAFRRAIAIKPDYADAHINLAEMLGKQGHLDRALSACREAAVLAPENPAVYCSVGRILMKKNEHENAAEALKKALAIDPENIAAAEIIVSLPSGFLDATTLSGIRGIFEHSDDTIEAQFSKVHFLRHAGKIDAAFEALCLANAEKSQTLQNEIQNEELNCRSFSAELSKWTPRKVKATATSLRKVFILGPSRSGKSSFEKTLAKSKKVYPFFELGTQIFKLTEEQYPRQKQPPHPNTHPDVSFSKLFKQDEEKLIAQGFEVITCTNPHILSFIPFIADMIPNSYFVFVHRDRHDVAAEIFATHYATSNFYSYNPNTIIAYLKWYEEAAEIVKSKLTDRVMTASFENIMRHPDELVQQMNVFVKADLELASQTQTGNKNSSQSVFREKFKSYQGGPPVL